MKIVFAVSTAISRMISAEPVLHNTGDELIDTALNNFEEGNMEKYGEFAPPESYLRMLKPKYGKSQTSKTETNKSKQKKKWKPTKFKIKFGSDYSGSSDSYWSCDSSDSSCSDDGDRYIHHYKSGDSNAAVPALFLLCCIGWNICAFICCLAIRKNLVGKKDKKYKSQDDELEDEEG